MEALSQAATSKKNDWITWKSTLSLFWLFAGRDELRAATVRFVSPLVVPFFISDARSCHRYLEPNDCCAPIPHASSAPSMTWLRNGFLVFDSLDRGTNLALPESVGFSLMSLTWVEASVAPLMCAFGHDFQKPFFWGYKVCTSWQCLATWSEWMEVWYPFSCWRSCESRGIELCAR